MRLTFANELENLMKSDENIIVLTADLGFGVLDNIKQNFSNRFFNVGAAEHLLIGAAIGLAEEGKIPVCYSITNFLLYRPFEMLRNYVNYESIPVKLVGSGRDKDYAHDGISHWSEDADDVMKLFQNIGVMKPNTKADIVSNINEFIYNKKPMYMNLPRIAK